MDTAKTLRCPQFKASKIVYRKGKIFKWQTQLQGTKYCFAIVDSSYSWPPIHLSMPQNIFQPWWQKWSQSLAGAQSIGAEMLGVGKDSDACETQPMIPLNFLCHGSPSNYWAHVPGPSGMGNPSFYLKKPTHSGKYNRKNSPLQRQIYLFRGCCFQLHLFLHRPKKKKRKTTFL